MNFITPKHYWLSIEEIKKYQVMLLNLAVNLKAEKGEIIFSRLY